MASIETLLSDLIDAVKDNTATLKGAMSGKTTVAADDKGKDEGKGDTGTKTTTRRSSKATEVKAPTQAALKKAAEEFLDKAGNDEEDYNARRAHIKKIIGKFDSPKFTEIAEDDRQAALEMLAKFDEVEEGSNKRDDSDI